MLTSATTPEARRAFIAQAFRVVRVRQPILLTGYYAPELVAHRRPGGDFRHPIYGRPPDLVDVDPSVLDTCHCRAAAGRVIGDRLFPFFTRAEIDGGALAGRGLEIAWANDPLTLFALHVQGSGQLVLDDGARMGVHFAGTNGRPYRSIGRALMERGLVPPAHATMPELRQYLAGLAPVDQANLLEINERYTFFRLADHGPKGSFGVELTPGRSVATDPRLVPRGTLAYLRSGSATRFIVSHDTGAAVQGAHADLFFGAGADAEDRAGRLKENGSLYLLLPRS